jgi:hypothetical protein
MTRRIGACSTDQAARGAVEYTSEEVGSRDGWESRGFGRGTASPDARRPSPRYVEAVADPFGITLDDGSLRWEWRPGICGRSHNRTSTPLPSAASRNLVSRGQTVELADVRLGQKERSVVF